MVLRHLSSCGLVAPPPLKGNRSSRWGGRYVSFSESHFQRECSWYASCPRYEQQKSAPRSERPRLHQIGSELCPTFSTLRVRPELEHHAAGADSIK